MCYQSGEEIYLFGYTSLNAVFCATDYYYESIEDMYDEWDDLIDENGWIEIDDPLPDCQHDAFIPIRVKGRNIGNPEWGKYEILKDGKWVEYKIGERSGDYVIGRRG
jgi:hypothetical protein